MTCGPPSPKLHESDSPALSDLDTVRARLEEMVGAHQQTVERERQSAFRRMAGEVAHQFSETLSGILARAQNLIEDDHDEQVKCAARMIEQVALEGSRTVRRLQEFSRTCPARAFEALDLKQLVCEVADSVRARWSESLAPHPSSGEVHADTAPLPLVSGDVAELRHVLAVVADNAANAMPLGGRLTFSTGVDGPQVFCRVADTGRGMTNEVRQQIFDPFFTTKREKSPGFGLGGAYAIVDRHGGQITVESEVGKGSAFTIWLPVAESRETAPPSMEVEAAPATVPAQPSSSGAEILVVDDSEEVREVVRDILVRQGHTVVTCADGEAGLAAVEARPFDIAMVDLALPDMSGLEVADRLKGRRPDTSVVVMTGYFDRMGPEGTQAKGVDFVLTKPFSLEQLRLAIHHAYNGVS